MVELDIIKKPYQKSKYNDDTRQELALCVSDPLYFMINFMKIQHPIKGAVPFVPYPFQVDLINAFHNHRFTIGLTARQMGKCLQTDSIITKEHKAIKIGSLIPQGFRERVVGWLEEKLLKLALKTQ